MARYYGTDEIISFTVDQMPYNPLRSYNNRSPEEKAKHHKLFTEMINNRIFIERLSILSLYRVGVFDEGKRVKKEYEEIIDLINQEISRIER